MSNFYSRGRDSIHIGWHPVLSYTKAGRVWLICILGVKLAIVGNRWGMSL